MGLWEWVFGEPFVPAPLARAEGDGTSDVERAIARAVSDRQAAFTLGDAKTLPAVARGIDLITSLGSAFTPVEYTDGIATDLQPSYLRQPDPFRPRWEFFSQTLLDILDHGEWYWLVGERREGYPAFTLVIPHDEVRVEWDGRRFLPIYEWRGRTLRHGIDLYHGAINRKAGELHGRSTLVAALPYLATVAAAEAYAAASFGSGGVPQTVLTTAGKLTDAEAARLKAQWAEARRLGTLDGLPAVASGGVTPSFPGVDPQKMQMQEARAYGASVVARILGIPAALLLVETSGATITYTNPEGAIDDFVKVTLAPRYLHPIETALAALVPRTKSVRFSLTELHRADVKTRWEVYQIATAIGAIAPQEIRAAEGFPPSPPTIARVPALAPVPAIETSATVVSEEVIPVG